MKLRKILAAAGVPLVLASGLGLATAGSAQASDISYFWNAYPSRAVCLGVAHDLREGGWAITTDCVRNVAGGSYILRAQRSELG